MTNKPHVIKAALKCVDKLDAKMPDGYYQILNSDREVKIWNEAIEQAAKIVERSETNLTKLIAEDVRGLKKMCRTYY